ncbi:MAG: SAM-dependent methyltransferase [Bacteroidetes bacterium]|nr:SAM-dependent methyltransferase [Bacteroidota bacterium]
MSHLLLIPAPLHEEGLQALPAYVWDAILSCQVFVVENERTTRRYFKSISKDIIIDNYEWINVEDPNAIPRCKELFKEGKTIGLVSEAGCPGVADPGQAIVALAHETGCPVRPLVGPNSILLALMASGLNGQQFKFNGYLPIEDKQREKSIQELELQSRKDQCTQLLIETPYRNNPMLKALLKCLSPNTQLCIAADLTSHSEWVATRTVVGWRKEPPDLHRRLVIFAFKAS